MADMTKMTSIEQLNSAVEATKDQPLLLFKHSTRCPIRLKRLSGDERLFA